MGAGRRPCIRLRRVRESRGLLASVFALKARRDASQDGCEIVPFDFVQPSGSLFIGLTLAFEPVSQLLQKLETVEAGPVTI